MRQKHMIDKTNKKGYKSFILQKYYDTKGSNYRAAQSSYAHPVHRMMLLKQHGDSVLRKSA